MLYRSTHRTHRGEFSPRGHSMPSVLGHVHEVAGGSRLLDSQGGRGQRFAAHAARRSPKCHCRGGGSAPDSASSFGSIVGGIQLAAVDARYARTAQARRERLAIATADRLGCSEGTAAGCWQVAREQAPAGSDTRGSYIRDHGQGRSRSFEGRVGAISASSLGNAILRCKRQNATSLGLRCSAPQLQVALAAPLQPSPLPGS